MKASIESWRLWEKEQEYPVLVLQASKEEVKETEALLRLEQICKGLRGLGYKQTLAARSNPDKFKEQPTNFVIDLGTLLTLVSEIDTNKAVKAFATGWLTSLVKSLKSREPKAIDDALRCRCGQVFKNQKIRKNHQKKCSILQRDMPLLRRVHESLKALKGKRDGNQTAKGTELRSNTKAVKVQPKVSARQKRKSKR